MKLRVVNIIGIRAPHIRWRMFPSFDQADSYSAHPANALRWIKAVTGCPVIFPTTFEENVVTTYEMYYLILVCSAFVGLGFVLAVETYVYRRSLGHNRAERHLPGGGE